MKEFRGIITPAISPFKGNEVNELAIEKLMKHLHRIGVSGVFPLGSNGSSPFISVEMHKKIMDIFAKYRKSGEYFLPGTGKNNVEDTIEISKYAEDIGSDAVVIVTPYYMKISQDSIYSFFENVISKISAPVILYNIPQFTGNTISPETVIKLAENFSNVVGIKDSSGDLSRFKDYILSLPKNFSVFQGQDELLLSSLNVGASGGVCGTTNFVELAVQVMKAYDNGKYEDAMSIQRKLSRIKNYLNTKPFPQAYSYLFHKIVMGEDFTGTLPMLSSLDKVEMKEIYSKFIDLKDKE